MLAFRFLADALGVSQHEGKARWGQAQQRLQRRQMALPPTTRVKPPGARQATPQLAANDAAKALRLVLKRPLEEFFAKEAKLGWLRGQIAAAGGDPATADAELAELLAERAQQEADIQSLMLPGLQTDEQASFRTTREDGEVLGSNFDYLRWLGLTNVKNEWHNWLREAFCDAIRQCLDSYDAETLEDRVVYVEKQLPNQSLPTPFTNFAGYRLLAKLCLHKSKIAQAMYDQAMTLLGQHAVGDQRLHASLDANAAQASEPARAFVLGSAEAAKQAKKRPLDLDDFERGILEDDSIDPETAAKRMAKAAMLRRHREASCQQLSVFKKQTLADLVKLIDAGTLSGKIGKQLLPDLLEGAGGGPGGVQALVDAKGLGQISDPAALEALVDGVLVANPKQLAQFRAGKTKLQASDGRGACGVGGSWGGWRGRGAASGGLPRAPPHPARRHAPPTFRLFLWGNS